MNKRPRLKPESISDHFKFRFAETKIAGNFEQHIYFLTARFDPTYSGRLANIQLDEFGRLYFKLNRQLLGNHLDRKRKNQPLCYAFVDAEGSRIGTSEIFKCAMPHIHAVILIAPQNRSAFEKFFSASSYEALAPLRSINIESYDPKKGSVEKLISYCMKGYLQSNQSHFQREDLWAVFPK